jgi:hypothetical protein
MVKSIDALKFLAYLSKEANGLPSTIPYHPTQTEASQQELPSAPISEIIWCDLAGRRWIDLPWLFELGRHRLLDFRRPPGSFDLALGFVPPLIGASLYQEGKTGDTPRSLARSFRVLSYFGGSGWSST